jgi:D-3-phosphoglycerate dehydrogenase / 2-oxoglutarate reductase
MDMMNVFVHELLDPSGHSIEWLESRGVAVTRGHPTWVNPPQTFSEQELIERARGHIALMGASTHPITESIIDALPELRYISKYGRGVDSIDVEAASRRGILVCNTPIDSNFDAVAEHTIAAMLTLSKNLLYYTSERMSRGGWRTDEAWSQFLRSSTLGIIGFGRIGAAVAYRLRGWGIRIVAYDPYVRNVPQDVELVGFEELLATSDFVSLHAVVTPETYHLIDEEALRLMRPGSYLINTARGGLMDIDAVHQALASGRLAGVAMDAYESEPPPTDHPIFRCENVIATPHTSAWTRQTFEEIAQVGAENLYSMLRGEVPAYCVNAEAADGGG